MTKLSCWIWISDEMNAGIYGTNRWMRRLLVMVSTSTMRRANPCSGARSSYPGFDALSRDSMRGAGAGNKPFPDSFHRELLDNVGRAHAMHVRFISARAPR